MIRRGGERVGRAGARECPAEPVNQGFYPTSGSTGLERGLHGARGDPFDPDCFQGRSESGDDRYLPAIDIQEAA